MKLTQPLPTWFFWTMIGALAIGLVTVSTLFYCHQLECASENPIGRIVFTDQDPVSGNRFLMIMDGNGNRLQTVPLNTGNTSQVIIGWLLPTWSPDGHQIAVLCDEPRNICLINSDTIPNLRSFPIKDLGATIPVVTQKLKIPDVCQEAVSSISWSPDGRILAIVCGNSTSSQMCFLSVENDDSYCWEDNLSQSLGSINEASWSPNEAILAVEFKKTSDASQIYLANPAGEIIRFLATGNHPEWSPDGQQLAFFSLDQERQYVGIAMIDVNGVNQEWLYRPPQRGSDIDTEEDKISPACNIPSGCGYRLAWSPDGRYIAFSSSWRGSNYVQIFRVDVMTTKLYS